jgi:hypothetical protein
MALATMLAIVPGYNAGAAVKIRRWSACAAATRADGSDVAGFA